MKNMRDHLFTLGASLVLTLSVVLAQDQAPVMAPPPDPLPDAAPPAAPVAKQPSMLPAQRTYSPFGKRPGTLQGKPAAAAASASVADAGASGEAKEPKAKTTTPALKFDNAPADIILQAYAQETGKTLLMAPDVPKANITLKSQPEMQLTEEEYVEAIEVVLSMNGIVLEPFGEKFIKVLARKTVRTDGIKIIMESPEGGHPEKSQVVSQMIQLKSILVAEAQKALEGFKKPDGLIQTFERTNSLLVTDTQENVNRMLEIVKFIDQPLVATEEVNVRTIRFAKADDIKKRIEELVAESQKQTQAKEEIKANTSGAPGITRTTGTTTSTRPLPPGLTRLGTRVTTPAPSATPNETLETLVSDADRGMIRGKVQIIADERTNQLIIITRADNMAFFDRIITVLDIETTPDVKVEVQRLEYADAEEVSTMLNDLIGNATSKKDDKAPATAAKGTTGASGAEQPAKSTSLAEAVAARAASRAEAATGEPSKSKLGKLSKDNIKILSDKRTNALIIMGSVGDLAAIKEIVKSMDIQLAQVLIETVVLEVRLDDTLKTGVDWVQRHVTGNDNSAGIGSGGEGNSEKSPLDLFGAALAVATNSLGETVGSTLTPYPNFQYYASLKKLNLDGVISASKTDGRSKILTSPILMTQDNKEATLEATELQYLYKGMRYMGYSSSSSFGGGGGNYEPDIEQRDVGLTVKITPRISPNGMVILTVDEKFEEVAGTQKVPGSGGDWPVITTRKMAADISLQNGETVILGGLVKNKYTDSSSGIPLLKDIPIIGPYLFGSVSKSQNRSELVVFLTPHVFTTPDEALFEAKRRKEYLNAYDVWTKGWSSSKIADPVSAFDLKRIEGEKEKLSDAWKAYGESLDKQKKLDLENRLERDKSVDLLKEQQNLNEAAVFGILKEPTNSVLNVGVLKPSAVDGMRLTGDPGRPPVAPEAPPAAFGIMKESVKTEVLKPSVEAEPVKREVMAPSAPADEGGPLLTGDAGREPVAPEIEPPRKPWWKIF